MAAARDEDEDRRSWFRREILPLEPWVRAYLTRTAGHRGDVDDLTQDALLKVFTARNWRHIGSARSYLRSVAMNLVRDLFRREKVVPIDSLAALGDWEPWSPEANPEEICAARAELRLLASVIDALPPRCREAMSLRMIHGLSTRQIAERMGSTVSTVETQLARGLQLCTKKLAECRAPAPKQETNGWRRSPLPRREI